MSTPELCKTCGGSGTWCSQKPHPKNGHFSCGPCPTCTGKAPEDSTSAELTDEQIIQVFEDAKMPQLAALARKIHKLATPEGYVADEYGFPLAVQPTPEDSTAVEGKRCRNPYHTNCQTDGRNHMQNLTANPATTQSAQPAKEDPA